MSGLKAGKDKVGKVIGVVEDFHLKSLHQSVEPLAITLANQSYFLDNFLLKIETSNIQGILADLKPVLRRHAPHNPFEYFFLDDAFQNLYLKEIRLSKLFSIFTMLAIFISCLGMFSLVAITCNQRTKEIGIRKVLGGTYLSLLSLISKEFIFLVALSLCIAFPISYLLSHQWLDNYAYHIRLSVWFFLLGGGLALISALVTVFIKTSRVILINPVESLRDE